MKHALFLIVLFWILSAVPLTAVERSGYDLLVDCANLVATESVETLDKEKVLGVGYCIGLIDGLVSFNYVYEAVLLGAGRDELVQICLPERVSTRQLAATIVAYLEEHPERRSQSGQALASHALVQAYPCPSEAPD